MSEISGRADKLHPFLFLLWFFLICMLLFASPKPVLAAQQVTLTYSEDEEDDGDQGDASGGSSEHSMVGHVEHLKELMTEGGEKGKTSEETKKAKASLSVSFDAHLDISNQDKDYKVKLINIYVGNPVVKGKMKPKSRQRIKQDAQALMANLDSWKRDLTTEEVDKLHLNNSLTFLANEPFDGLQLLRRNRNIFVTVRLDAATVRSLDFVQAKAPFTMINELLTGGSFRVKVVYDSRPKSSSQSVHIKSKKTSKNFGSDARATEDPKVFLTNSIRSDTVSNIDGDIIEAMAGGKLAGLKLKSEECNNWKKEYAEVEQKINDVETSLPFIRQFELLNRTMTDVETVLADSSKDIKEKTEHIEKLMKYTRGLSDNLTGTLNELKKGLSKSSKAMKDVSSSVSKINEYLATLEIAVEAREKSAPETIRAFAAYFESVKGKLEPLVDSVPVLGVFLNLYTQAISAIAESAERLDKAVASTNVKSEQLGVPRIYVDISSPLAQIQREKDRLYRRLNELKDKLIDKCGDDEVEVYGSVIDDIRLAYQNAHDACKGYDNIKGSSRAYFECKRNYIDKLIKDNSWNENLVHTILYDLYHNF